MRTSFVSHYPAYPSGMRYVQRPTVTRGSAKAWIMAAVSSVVVKEVEQTPSLGEGL